MRNQPNNLRINREGRRFLGVCAGLADYFDVPVLLVRVVFVICIITWPTLIFAYFLLYFLLDKQIDPDRISDALKESGPVEHFKNLDYKRPIYRNMRNRTIAGVCSGLADYLEVNTTIVRIIAVCSIFILGPYALLAYVVGWIAMEPNPAPRSNGIRYGGRRSRRAGYRSRRRRHRFAASRLSSSRSDDGDQDADLYGDTGDGSDDPLYSGSGSPAAAARGRRERHTRHNPEPETVNQESVERCTDLFYALESRMRSLEAFITSKKFRLHCEINRI